MDTSRNDDVNVISFKSSHIASSTTNLTCAVCPKMSAATKFWDRRRRVTLCLLVLSSQA